ncbi:MAG: M48 family metalloprotease [Candidatus Thorarchaeota archaeon]
MTKKIQINRIMKYFIIAGYLFITIGVPIICTAFNAIVIIITFYSTIFILGTLWYWRGAYTILRKNKIQFLIGENCKELQESIIDLKKKIGLKVNIKIGILDEALPNAFTLFLGLRKYSIILSVGIFENLESNEIKAVIAHELFHIKNRDVWVKALFIIGRFISFPMGPLIESYISRSREVHADLKSSKFTRDPLSLASALLKMLKCYQSNPELVFNINNVSKSFWIINHSNKKHKSIIRKLLSRHPSIEKRIKVLMKFKLKD